MDAKKFKSSIRTKILLGFGSAVIVALIAGITVFQSFKDLTYSLNFLSKPDTKIIKLNDILADLSGIENNIRAYSVTKDSTYLDHYSNYCKEVENDLDSLKNLSQALSVEEADLNNMTFLWEEKKKHHQKLIKLFEKKPEASIPASLLRKLYANPDSPQYIVTKKIVTTKIIQQAAPTEDSAEKDLELKENDAGKKSLLNSVKKIFRRKVKEDTLPVIAQTPTVFRETNTIIDTIKNEKEPALQKKETVVQIISHLKNEDLKSQQLLAQNESEIIENDNLLIEKIREIIINLKNKEQKRTDANITKAKGVVKESLIKIFSLGIIGIASILIFSLMIMGDVKRSNFHKNQLMDAKTQAEDLARTKELFLATMSHEIRTPLNSILGFTEQLSQTNLLNRQKYFLQAINNSTSHLLLLVNDILDISRIESGKIEFEKTVFNLKDIIENVYDSFFLKAAEKELLFSFNDENINYPFLNGDPLRLKQIIYNLVSNALKFTEEGKVQLHCSALALENNKCRVSIVVTDTGIGISPDKIHSIFESFNQGDSSITRKFGGSGLGLAICKKLVEMQGGEIRVKSVLGSGSEFHFFIDYEISAEEYIQVTKPKFTAFGSFKDLKILIAEDDEFNLLLFHTIISKWNMKAKLVSNGEEAFSAALQEPFDIIITDVHMPGMSGFDLVKKLKNHKDLKKIPVIATTANVVKDALQKAQSSFDAVVLKPFKEDELAEAIYQFVPHSDKENILSKEEELTTNQENILEDFIKFSDGDIQALSVMIDTFIQSASSQIENLEGYSKDKDWGKIKFAAHKMIPGFGHLKNQELTELLKELENYLELKERPDEVLVEEMVNKINYKGKIQIDNLLREKAKITQS
ncbi:ATP-binding protein [Sporocytophaga myxococcoides]|uniref:ATP-binding protein n=1 Tax=Sporocytophaga myxococcoides TaxID=153721 RepID=UPI00040C9F7E|nr:ATP-binding protein [Sporocytophaga myxococcoides]